MNMLRGPIALLVFLAAGAGASADPSIVDDVRHSFHGAGSILLPRVETNSFFSGNLAGVKVSAITNTGNSQRPFEVDGDTFTDFASAADRACDDQKNACAQMANNGTANIEVSQCDQQNTQCKAAITSASSTSSSEGNLGTQTTAAVATLFSSNSEFEFFCV